MHRTALAAGLLFASGACGLVYEVAWARQLGPLLGHTADAAAVVVASYFVGLAAGAAIGGRLAVRMRRPLLGYAIAEAIAALWALALAPLLDLTGAASLAQTLHEAGPATKLVARAGVALVALLPATIALGTTIPLVAAHTRTLRSASWAYAANLAGAVAGTALATFYLLGSLGVSATNRVAVVIALVTAAVAAITAARSTPAPAPAPTPADASPPPARTTGASLGVALAILSGLGSAIAQVLFTRALALTFHNSTYTFGAVVTAFLLSLSAGAALAARTRATLRAAALAALLAAILLPGGVITLWATTQGLGYFSAFGDFAGYLVSALGLAVLIVAPAVTAMAMLLPLAWRLAGPDDDSGRETGHTIGRLTAANNLAGAAGALLAALALVPALGLWNCFALVTALYAITGAVLARRAKLHRAIIIAALAAAAAVAAVARPVPQPRQGDRLLTRWETRYGWLEVHEDRRGERRLRHNIHYGLASSDSDLRQRRVGQLPLLLHPSPRRALFFGLSTGITAGGAVADPRLERLDVVELIPEVVHAARAFAAWNGGVLDDPRTKIHVGDARFWLRGSRARWDVIVTDLHKPWESHAGYLYTVEHYREVARHLAPGGLHVQWLALWQVAEADVALIADTTRAVFPTVVLVRGDDARRWGLLAIVASDRPLAIDGAAFARAAAALAPPPRHPDRLLTTPRRLVELYVGDWPLRPGATLNRDDSLRLELDAPKRDRSNLTLTGDRLVDIYRRVWSRLARVELTYTPPPGEHPWDADYGLRQQMGAAGEDGTPPE